MIEKSMLTLAEVVERYKVGSSNEIMKAIGFVQARGKLLERPGEEFRFVGSEGGCSGEIASDEKNRLDQGRVRRPRIRFRQRERGKEPPDVEIE